MPLLSCSQITAFVWKEAPDYGRPWPPQWRIRPHRGNGHSHERSRVLVWRRRFRCEPRAQLSVFALDDHLDRLYGSARKHLIAAAKRLGIGVHEEPFDLDTPHGAQGTIVTNSSNLCLFAEEFESKSFGGGSPEVAEALRAEVNREFTEATAI